jgi:hypothetical protein
MKSTVEVAKERSEDEALRHQKAEVFGRKKTALLPSTASRNRVVDSSGMNFKWI